MFYNVTIEKNERLSKEILDNWEIKSYVSKKNNREYKYLINNTINQKISIYYKLNKEFNSFTVDPNHNGTSIRGFNASVDYRWGNDRKTLKPILYPATNNSNKQDVIYLTLDTSDYQLLGFRTNFPILQTYHKVNKFCGCAVIVDKSKIEKYKNIISFIVKDEETQAYNKVEVKYDDEAKELMIRNRELTDISLEKWDELSKKYENISLTFKVDTKNNDIPTSTIVTVESCYDKVKELMKNIKNINIISLNDNIISEDGIISDSIVDILSTDITEYKIKAITTVGFKLPYTYAKKLKLLYTFVYGLETSRLNCLKSL